MLLKRRSILLLKRTYVFLVVFIVYICITKSFFQVFTEPDSDETVDEFKNINIKNQISDLNREISQLKKLKDNLIKEFEGLEAKLGHEVDELKRIDKARILSTRKKIEKNYTKIINDKKSLDSCFNFEKCELNSKIKLHFLNNQLELEIKNNDIYEHVNSSSEACLVIYFLTEQDDANSISTASTIHAKNNLLVINTIDDESNLLNQTILDCASHASFNYHRSLTNRHENLFFHFSILKLNLYDSLKILFNMQKNNRLQLTYRRKHLLVYYQSSNFKLSGASFQINCDYSKCRNTSQRLRYLSSSTFMLINNSNLNNSMIWSQLLTKQLIEALSVGTIPLLLDLESQLPLSELINWNEVIIRLSKADINDLEKILQNFNEADIISRRIKASKIYNQYFQTPQKQLNTLLTAVRERIRLPAMPLKDYVDTEVDNYPLVTDLKVNMSLYIDKSTQINTNEVLGPVIHNGTTFTSKKYQFNMTFNSYFAWNVLFYPFNLMPKTPFDQFLPIDLKYSSIGERTNPDPKYYYGGSSTGKYFHEKLGGNSDDNEQFTIVILTYNRERLLISVLLEYFKLPHLNQIIVVWNSIEIKPTNAFYYVFQKELNLKLLRIVFGKNNSLSNRFLPFDFIRTDAILSLDDDTQIKNDEITFGFRIWRENRERIVGYPTRFHTWEPRNKKFQYRTESTCEYSLILTGAAFYHRFYNYYYHNLLQKRIVSMIDEFMNCEDIAFNFMISDLTRKPPIRITNKTYFFCKLCSSDKKIEKSLSANISHYERRTTCMNYFSFVYGYSPLLYSQARIDSIFYRIKSSVTGYQPCFAYV